MKTEVKEIPFNGSVLLGIKDQSGHSVRKSCLDIGLTEGQARRQVENIQEEEPLNLNCRKFAIVQMEGKRDVTREQLFLHEKLLPYGLLRYPSLLP